MAGVVNNEGPRGYLDTLEAVATDAKVTATAAQNVATTAATAASVSQAKAQAAYDMAVEISAGDALTAHINSETPHPIYDDGPSLALLYNNAKV